jgi:hypothetical protein
LFGRAAILDANLNSAKCSIVPNGHHTYSESILSFHLIPRTKLYTIFEVFPKFCWPIIVTVQFEYAWAEDIHVCHQKKKILNPTKGVVLLTLVEVKSSRYSWSRFWAKERQITDLGKFIILTQVTAIRLGESSIKMKI